MDASNQHFPYRNSIRSGQSALRTANRQRNLPRILQGEFIFSGTIRAYSRGLPLLVTVNPPLHRPKVLHGRVSLEYGQKNRSHTPALRRTTTVSPLRLRLSFEASISPARQRAVAKEKICALEHTQYSAVDPPARDLTRVKCLAKAKETVVCGLALRSRGIPNRFCDTR
jgi:hypothetical protein